MSGLSSLARARFSPCPFHTISVRFSLGALQLCFRPTRLLYLLLLSLDLFPPPKFEIAALPQRVGLCHYFPFLPTPLLVIAFVVLSQFSVLAIVFIFVLHIGSSHMTMYFSAGFFLNCGESHVYT